MKKKISTMTEYQIMQDNKWEYFIRDIIDNVLGEVKKIIYENWKRGISIDRILFDIDAYRAEVFKSLIRPKGDKNDPKR